MKTNTHTTYRHTFPSNNSHWNMKHNKYTIETTTKKKRNILGEKEETILSISFVMLDGRATRFVLLRLLFFALTMTVDVPTVVVHILRSKAVAAALSNNILIISRRRDDVDISDSPFWDYLLRLQTLLQLTNE